MLSSNNMNNTEVIHEKPLLDLPKQYQMRNSPSNSACSTQQDSSNKSSASDTPMNAFDSSSQSVGSDALDTLDLADISIQNLKKLPPLVARKIVEGEVNEEGFPRRYWK